VCRMCEGFSLEDVLALDEAHIAEYGFMVVGVGREDDERRAPWAYTVGLLDAADHPELIIAGASLQLSGAFLSGLAHMVLDDGDRFEAGDEIDIERGIMRFGRSTKFSTRSTPSTGGTTWPSSAQCTPMRSKRCRSCYPRIASARSTVSRKRYLRTPRRGWWSGTVSQSRG